MSRLTKQIFYGLFYIACWVAVGGLVYFVFLRPAPGCMNGRQDEGEEDIDCGGICANACLPSTLKVIENIGGVRIFQPTPTTLELAAKIQNANFALTAKSFSYHFNVYGAPEQPIEVIRGESYIYGGEVKYLVAIKTNIDYKPSRAELVIENPVWAKASDYERPVFGGVQDQNVQVGSSTIEVSGKVVNKDIIPVHDVVITTLFYSNLGLPAGISQTTLDSLNPEEVKPFSVFHPVIADIVPDKTEIFINAKRQ